MTSPSHKKHPTTRPSTQAKGADPRRGRLLDVVVSSTVPRRSEPMWLPAGLLATLLLLTMTASSFGGDSALKWRAAGSQAHTQTQATKHVVNDAQRGKISAARFIDPNVRSVAHHHDAWNGRDNRNRPNTWNGRDTVQLAQATGDLNSQFEEPLFDPDSPAEPPKIDGGDAFETLPKQRDAGFDPFDGDNEGDNERDIDDRPVANELQKNGSGTKSSSMSAKERKKQRDNSESRSKERQQAAEDCAKELASLRGSNLAMLDITIGQSGVEGEDYPYVCSIDDGIPLSTRCWAPITYTWKASALCHKPLYFEQEALERYGHSWGPIAQPIVSGAHFFSRLPALPYMMGLRAPNECVYALGHYRPGNCAPYLLNPVPFTWRAALFQAGAWTGGVFAIP